MDAKHVSVRKDTLSDWTLRASKSKPGKFYYYNVKTKKTTWTRPEDFVEEANKSHLKTSAASQEKVPPKRSSTCMLPDTSTTEKRHATKNFCVEDKVPDKRTPGTQSFEAANKREVLVAKRSSSGSKSSISEKKTDKNEKSSNVLQGNQLRKTIKARRSKAQVGEQPVSVSAAVEIVNTSMRSEVAINSVVTNINSNISNERIKSFNKVKENENLRAAEKIIDQTTLPSVKNKKYSPRSIEKRRRKNSHHQAEHFGNAATPKRLQESGTPAADRLTKLQAVLKSKQEANQVLSTSLHFSPQNREENFLTTIDQCEVMDVEYMESEVLSDIGELRRQDVGLQLIQPPVFMDMDVDYFEVTNQLEPEKTFYVVLDTNILLSHLTFAEGLRDTIISGKGAVHLYLPWQVIHELDNLKDRGRASIQPLARKAINYLHQNFSSKHPRVCGQRRSDVAGNLSNSPDDNILEACLQLIKQGFNNVLLLSNDKNLLNKALICDIQAFSKNEFTEKLCLNTPCYLTGSIISQNQTPNEVISCENNPLQNDIFCSELDCIIKDSLTEILSKGMEAEYKHLWKKRTLIAPPWTSEQALKCLSHHWLALCDNFIPRVVKNYIEDLTYFLKTKLGSEKITISDLKEGIRLFESVLASISKKYNSILVCIHPKIKNLVLKLDGAHSCDTASQILSCFEEVFVHAQNLCYSANVSTSEWMVEARSMVAKLQELIHFMELLLTITPDSLSEASSVVVDLVNSIKGAHQITAKDLVYFCQVEKNRIALQNGVQQFITFSTTLSNMLQSVSLPQQL